VAHCAVEYRRTFVLAIALLLTTANQSLVADQLTLEIDGQRIDLIGEILIEAQDDSLYFQGNDGKIWFVKPSQIIKRVKDAETSKPISKKELRTQLATQLGTNFRFHETTNYLLAYQTETNYAKWVGNLFQFRLYRGFEQFWRKKKFPLEKPLFPLVVLIFANEKTYQEFVDKEFGQGHSMVAHYNLLTNQVAMYDLTASHRPANQELSERSLNEILQSPAVLPMITTIIHEGTHQLIFNRGIQVRFAETPLWLNEGLAVFFETPSLESKSGWREPGEISYSRLSEFRKNLPKRPADSLQQMIRSDQVFLGEDSEKVLAAYAESWALTHFLLNKRSEAYISYLRHLAGKKPLKADSPETRLSEFELFFGDDWHRIDREFLEYVQKLK
jgi:hypothetical protein